MAGVPGTPGLPGEPGRDGFMGLKGEKVQMAFAAPPLASHWFDTDLLLFAVYLKGDACTSCPSLNMAVGDGVAVPGPKGERGDPGPSGEGKPGRNVTKQCI